MSSAAERLSTSGKVYVGGVDMMHAGDVEIAEMGVGTKVQTPTVFDSLTVCENMDLPCPEQSRYCLIFGAAKQRREGE